MLINNIPFIMIKCLILTVLIEMTISLIIRIRNKKDILNIILANFVTNPIVVIVPVVINIKYGVFYRNIILYFLEILTVMVEGFIYFKVLNYKRINPFIISVILNMSSYLCGEILNKL